MAANAEFPFFGKSAPFLKVFSKLFSHFPFLQLQIYNPFSTDLSVVNTSRSTKYTELVKHSYTSVY